MRATLVLPPNREIDFDCACVCVACVRASEAASARRFSSGWGSAREFVGRRPSVVRAAISMKSSRSETFDR